jgi:NADH-quinone oxidoreductase subunit M
MLRFAIPLFPDAAVAYGLPIFGVLGAIGVVYAACCAFAQKDIKLMMAYSSVSHLGLLILGLFALNTEGLTGATLHMVNHGLSAGAMFALLGFLFDRYRTTDRTQFGGLLGKYPRFAFFMVVLCLASIGLPGLNNFISEMMLLSALFTPWNHGLHGLGLAVAGAAGLFLSAWYTMTMLKIVFFGPLKEPQTVEGAPTGDLTSREWTAFAVPAVLCLALGIYPQPVIDSMQGDLGVIARRLDEARQRANPDLAAEEAPKRAPVSIRDEAERRGMGGMLPPIGGAGAGAGQGAGGRPGGGGGGPPALPSPPGGGQ